MSDPLPSEKRKRLCSIEHANRVASQVAERTSTDTAVVSTDNPLQPYRVVLARNAPPRRIVSRVLTCDMLHGCSEFDR
jgi:hypothetical protein